MTDKSFDFKKKNIPATETFESSPPSSRWRSLRSHLTRENIKRLYSQALHRFGVPGIGHLLVGSLALTAGLVTVHNSNLVRLWDRQMQTLFFDLRGPVALPQHPTNAAKASGVIILAMDSATINQGQFYAADRQTYGYLQPIERWPWQRKAYAIAIERLLQAGARAVAIDVVFDTPSSYGPEDDAAFQQVLAKYPGRVVLAAQYVEGRDRSGESLQLLAPNAQLEAASPNIGFINFLLNEDGRIHQLGAAYQTYLTSTYGPNIPIEVSFAQAAVQSAQMAPPAPNGTDIFFYGPTQTFEQVPFWNVLDGQYWQEYHLPNQTFKNKIVVIGPTDQLFQDFHAAPFSGTLFNREKMAGVEIQANAIASLMENQSIRQAFPQAWLRGAVVLGLVAIAGYLQSRAFRPSRRFLAAIVIAALWGGISYGFFVRGQLMWPTAIPMLATLLSGVTYLGTGIVSEKLGIRRAAKRYASSPIFQEFISDVTREVQHTNLRPLLEENHRKLTDKLLDGRYKIVSALASGGFGATYLAEDRKRPGNPQCVVKQLSPRSNNPKVIQYARDRFPREAETLEKLGKHPQIPQLLAYFEENDEFYLVLEYINGKSLDEELQLSHHLKRHLPERLVVALLYDLLQILDFVHTQGVIHRDVKPSNIMRQEDGRLVLIDFGAVKEFGQLEEIEDQSQFTVAIGTDGFMAPEQAHGKPRPASDIYSAGIIGIQALTGIAATDLKNRRDTNTAELQWRDSAQVSHTLAEILDRMVNYSYITRYHTAKEVLQALVPLMEKNQFMVSDTFPTATNAFALESDEVTEGDTKLWPEALNLPPELPPTDRVASETELNETSQWSDLDRDFLPEQGKPCDSPSVESNDENDHRSNPLA